ncbi:uncharacterized protein Z518_02585 [Rhinocladiella mackenziei CBS 650.93]|uniref:Rhinocladiella mackenziei CBS 650.93 unplaced genomic scaffold supercont1.2, whole genome shotgun sequence n=1 Tax=Rhinocladiella mackenziei CBS 650.93 TaxID=1442369 RepID=A0A0D2IX56_9EURO|nr:uncharacterized protein Z518_02585 [Rhinocladiella mackenziei CBS 650.93]KIX07931.1 hypothetical protein Z518_02585 [Rhinocladiella mackenziei CBS 650.93]
MRSLFSSLCFTAVLVALVTNPAQAAVTLRDKIEKGIFDRAPATDPYPDHAGCAAAHVNDGKPSVFFSNLGSTTPAQRAAPDTFAATIGGKTFMNGFGNQPGNPSKRFTDRWSGPGSRKFSEVFAQQATGTAYVLLRATSGANGPKSNSVWTVLERSALEANPNVPKIVLVDPVTFAPSDLWVRGVDPPTTVKAKRQSGVIVLDWDAPADGPYWLAPNE